MSLTKQKTLARVCIVCPRHLSDTPRVVKEADALFQAGYDVRVVCSHGGRDDSGRDTALLSRRHWRFASVRWSRNEEFMLWALTGLRQRVFQVLPSSIWPSSRAAEQAEGRVYAELSAAAKAERADLYIGHYPDGLAAAADAAQHWNARLGFDAEDFHVGEGSNFAQTARWDFIQKRYLPRCTYLTAASRGIAEALSSRYAVTLPLVVHNVFPWADRQGIDNKVLDRRGDCLSMHWCSLRIGLDRGLQDAIRAVGRLGGQVQIHLRGELDDETRIALLTLASEYGVAPSIAFHRRVPTTELLSRANEHDVGLALEQGDTVNHSICASNKMFYYMLAGLAITATDVPGQREVLANMTSFARLYAPGDYESLASHLEEWRTNRDGLARAKREALECARRHWNWEVESQKLIEQVCSVLGGGRSDSEGPYAVEAKCR